MSYEKKTWVTGETITAEKLNHMEGGIVKNPYNDPFVINLTHNDQDQLMIDKTWQEITEAVEQGKHLILNFYDTLMSGPSAVEDQQGHLTNLIFAGFYVDSWNVNDSVLQCAAMRINISPNEIINDTVEMDINYTLA